MARARVKHYYKQRLMEPDFWQKLLNGRIGMMALKSLGESVRRMSKTESTKQSFQMRMGQTWRSFDKPIVLLLSEYDLTAQEFVEHANINPAWAGWSKKMDFFQYTLERADHTCSTPQSSRRCEELTLYHLQTRI